MALVTGGGRGIGRVLARALSEAGAAVGLLGRSKEQLEETAGSIAKAGGVACGVSADVTNAEAVAQAVREVTGQLGPISLLVNNAGIPGPVGVLWETDPEEWWHTSEVNLRGVFLCTRLVLPEMVASGRGRIINITSNAAVFRWPELSAYAVSKAAVVKLTENLAAETARAGVSVFSVDPGFLRIGLTETALAREAAEGSAHHRLAEWARQQLAEGRDIDPARAGDLVVQLAAGRGDALSGRHLSAEDDLDALLEHIDEIKRLDLRTLRLRRIQPSSR